MADTTTKTAQGAATTQKPATPTAAPQTAGQKLAEQVKEVQTPPTPADKKPRSAKTFCATADEAIKIASERTKGARRAFHAQFQGKDIYLVAFNEDQAGGMLLDKVGVQLEEIGKVAKVKAPKASNPSDVFALLAAMPITEEQKKEFLAKFQTLKTV